MAAAVGAAAAGPPAGPAAYWRILPRKRLRGFLPSLSLAKALSLGVLSCTCSRRPLETFGYAAFPRDDHHQQGGSSTAARHLHAAPPAPAPSMYTSGCGMLAFRPVSASLSIHAAASAPPLTPAAAWACGPVPLIMNPVRASAVARLPPALAVSSADAPDTGTSAEFVQASRSMSVPLSACFRSAAPSLPPPPGAPRPRPPAAPSPPLGPAARSLPAS